MHVLLTGGAGFIGRHVHRELLDRGHEVRVLDSLRPDVHGPDPVQVHGLLRGDVRDPDAVDRALTGVDAVIHLAAKVGLGVDAQDMPDYADSNVHGTAVLLAGMARAGMSRFVQASSMVVYGEGFGRCPAHGLVQPGPRLEAALSLGRFETPCPHCATELDPHLVDETAPLDPRNAYAVSKVGQEQLATTWARATSGRVVSLRYHNVYGAGMPRNTPYSGVAAIFLSELRSGRPPLVFEDGGQRRDFVCVRDVAAATVAALDRTGDPAPGSSIVLNVGSGETRTIGQLAAALATATGGPAPVVTGRFRLGDVRHITANSEKARVLLGWHPSVGLDEGVGELVQH
jgi:dTDP-L-rhamnose 4-epimerase